MILWLYLILCGVGLSQPTSDAHAQWRRLRKSNKTFHYKIKRQISGPPTAGTGGGIPIAGGMGAINNGGPPPGMMMGGSHGMHGHGMGSPQFMGPPGIHHEFSCIGRLPRLYQDPWMCSRYYWCNYGSPPVPFTCPQGQLFDQELQTCTMAMAVECRDFPEPLDALDMPAGGIGYHAPFNMNASPYGGMASVPVVSAAAAPLPPNPVVAAAIPAAVVVNPQNQGPQNQMNGMSMGGMSNSAGNVQLTPFNTNGLGGMNSNNGQSQAASLQGGSMMTPNSNINLNQFAHAILSANTAQNAANQAFLRASNTDNQVSSNQPAINTPGDTTACDSGKLGLFADSHKNCRTYYFCSPGGTKYEFQCPSHLLFSDRMKTCDSPENVVCDPPAFSGTSNQVVNGFAVGKANNLGFAGVMSAPGEAQPLRFPFQTMAGSQPGSGVPTNAIYSLPSGKRQAVSIPEYPGFSSYPGGAQSAAFNPYTIQARSVASNGQPAITSSLNNPSPNMFSGMNPYTAGQITGAQYGSASAYSGQLPHHVAQRSMQGGSVASNAVPQYNSVVSYTPYQPADPSQYPAQPAYPNGAVMFHHNTRHNTMLGGSMPGEAGGAKSGMPPAEPQMEGGIAYPGQMSNPYYPVPGQSSAGGGSGMPSYQSGMVPSQSANPHASSYPGSGGQYGHSAAGGAGGAGAAGARGRPKVPFFDPEAEFEAGRAHETPPAVAGGGGAGGGAGLPAGLNTFPGGSQPQVGPMMMEPDLPPSSVPTAGAEGSRPSLETPIGASTGSDRSVGRTEAISTGATIRPMTPDIILRVHIDNASLPLPYSVTPTAAVNATALSKNNLTLPENNEVIFVPVRETPLSLSVATPVGK